MATTAQEIEHPGHPGWGTYVVIGVILTVITALEVAVFYIPALHAHRLPILIALSLAKFVLVVMFYMHLKFDNRLFSTLFVGLLILAIALVIGLVVLFRFMPLYKP